MKQPKNMLKFLILLLVLISVVGVVSASENITSDEMNAISTADDLVTEDNDNPTSDILKIDNSQNDTLEGYYKKYTTVTNYYTTIHNIDLSKQTPSYPQIMVYVHDSSNNAVREGNVKFEVNGKNFTTSLTYSGSAYLSGEKAFGDLGKYTIKATYLGSSNYESSSTKFTYTLNGKTTISINDISVNKGQSITITPKVTPTLNSKYIAGNILLKINGYIYTLNSSRPSLTLNLKPGYYSCSAEYGANSYYIKSSTTFTIKVIDEPLIVAQDYYITVLGQENKLNIYVVNSEGDAISGGSLYLNNTRTSVSNGIAQFSLNPKDIAFDYYTVKYVPSASYYKTVTIKNAFPIATFSTTKLKITPLNTIAGTKISNVKYTITDALNNKISPSGYFIIKGKKYNSLKDFKTPKKAGVYKYTVKFIPDLILYKKCSATLKIVNKLKTKVKVKSFRGYENKKVKITAIVKDNLGKKVKKGFVTFKIKGKTYKAKVKNGKAVKKIRIPKPGSRATFYYYHYKNGKEIQTARFEPEVYKCKVVYNGNSKYLKSSSTFKIVSMKKSKSKEYYTPYNPPSESTSSSKKTTTKKKTTTSYGYTPTYYKPIPNLNVNLFKKEPAFNTNINLKDIIITT